jgi:nucleoside-diphosphate kinase
MERTLIIFKPDAVRRGLVGEILMRFEKAGLKLAALKMITATDEQLHGHYEGIGGLKTRKGDVIFNNTVNGMKGGPVIAGVLEGVEAVEQVRKMVGPTEPKSAAPGTIRGDYAHMSYGHSDKVQMGLPNLIHASADIDEAAKEIAYWFTADELHAYYTVHDVYTQPSQK